MILTPQGLKLTQDNHIIPITNITGLHRIMDVHQFKQNNMVILMDEKYSYIIQQIQGDKLIDNEQTEQYQEQINKFVKIYVTEQTEQSESIIGKNHKNEAYYFNLNNNQETFIGLVRFNQNWSDDEYYTNAKYFISQRDRTFYIQKAKNLKQLQQLILRVYIEKIQIQNQILIMKEGFLHKQIYFCVKNLNKFKLFRKYYMKKFYNEYHIKINGRDVIFYKINNQYSILDLANFKIKGFIISEHISRLRDQVFIQQYGLFAQLFQNHLYIYDSNFKQLIIVNIKKLVGICNNPRWVKYSETQGFTIFHDYKT